MKITMNERDWRKNIRWLKILDLKISLVDSQLCGPFNEKIINAAVTATFIKYNLLLPRIK